MELAANGWSPQVRHRIDACFTCMAVLLRLAVRADILEIMMRIVLRFVETRIIRRDKKNANNYPGNYGKRGQDEKNLEHY